MYICMHICNTFTPQILWYVPQLAVVHNWCTTLCGWPKYSHHSNRNLLSTALECNYILAVIVLYFWICSVFLGWYFCRYYAALTNYLPNKLNGIYSLSATRNSVWHWLTSRTSVGTTPFSTAQIRLNWINTLNVYASV